MHKRFGLVTSIMCLVLCCAFITFGVYAASRAATSFNSTVVFTPTSAKVRIKGLIADHKTGSGTVTNYYACNYNSTSTEDTVFDKWEFGDLSFQEATEDASNNIIVTPIKFYIQITNNVEAELTYSFKATFDTTLVVRAGYTSSLNAGISNTQYFDINTETAPTVVPTSVGTASTALTSAHVISPGGPRDFLGAHVISPEGARDFPWGPT